MDPLERQLQGSTRSWKAFVGSAVTSAALFVAMGATSIVIHRPKKAEAPPLTYAFVPPPPAPVKQKNTPPVSTSFAESFKFDPATAGPPPEIPLELLDITLTPDVNPGVAVETDLQRTFQVQKPDTASPTAIFERNQVDEIPVWLYGPQPRYPDHFDRENWNVLVLYTVSERGKTENIFILDATHPQLIEPVKKAIADWKFRAARKNGKAVKMWVQQAVNHEQDIKSPFTL
jgi:hypothetical protein